MILYGAIWFVVFASAAYASVQVQPWMPPGPQDSRGPCPMLNTLANHGYIGRNITATQIEDAFTKFLNIEAEFATAAKEFTRAWGHDHFNLDDLNAPDILQHIASLTRDDYTSQHPHLKPSLLRIELLLADSPTSFVNIDSIAKTRLRVQTESEPNALSDNQITAALTEAAMVLVMMSDHTPDATINPPLSAYQGPKDRIRAWFEQERFPLEFGWQPSKRMIKLADLEPAIKGIVKSMEQQEQKGHQSRIGLKIHIG
ncbi:chloroperoxidase [Trichoderma arundinaceum]|uniref:Chloroperoxidase n=1 Tax=Trichoderma arundinaceum TaxID=490622 RepID=A0A395NX40_TRIAR|nr:chloroperoxidase [Trichoderma arundinaceum]